MDPDDFEAVAKALEWIHFPQRRSGQQVGPSPYHNRIRYDLDAFLAEARRLKAKDQANN